MKGEYLALLFLAALFVFLFISAWRCQTRNGLDGYIGSGAKEDLTFFNRNNSNYWPDHLYPNSLTQFGGKWPPNMFSRSHNIQPGYDDSGLSYYLRPGMSAGPVGRNRWVKQNGGRYFINNGKDRTHDYYPPAYIEYPRDKKFESDLDLQYTN